MSLIHSVPDRARSADERSTHKDDHGAADHKGTPKVGAQPYMKRGQTLVECPACDGQLYGCSECDGTGRLPIEEADVVRRKERVGDEEKIG